MKNQSGHERTVAMKTSNNNCLLAVSVALTLGAVPALLSGCAARQREMSKAAAGGNVQQTLAPRPAPPAALVTFYSVPFR